MKNYIAFSNFHVQKGMALFTTSVIIFIVGIVAVSGMRLTEMSEVLSGNSIQRSRAIQAAEGGLMDGEKNATLAAEQRILSSDRASAGIFSRGSLEDYWWREDDYAGARFLDNDAFPGVVNPPKYAIEELGAYISDAGTGIVSLDRGGASYGSNTQTGREVVLFRIQTLGVGSTTKTKAVVESLYVENQ